MNYYLVVGLVSGLAVCGITEIIWRALAQRREDRERDGRRPR